MSMSNELGTRRRIGLTVLGGAGLALAIAAIVLSRLALAFALAGLAVVAAVVIALNLTVRSVDRARRRALRALNSEMAELEARVTLQAAVLSTLSIGVLAFREGSLIAENPAARGLIGERVESVDAVRPAAVRAVIERTAAEGGIHTTRFEIDYPPRTIEATARAVVPGPTVVLQLADISQQQRADVVRRDFVTAASHELKTPVAAIQAAAETVLAALEDDPAAVENFSRRIYDNATRLAHIVADLLDLSRLESRAEPVELLDLGKVVADEAARLTMEDVELTVEIEPARVTGNRADLGLAIRNLLENAIRYSSPGGRVTVRVEPKDDVGIAEVSDNGVGIPHNALPRIFERFFRVDAARSRASGGTGLGLAIVKHVAEQHGGAVEAESVLGQGSTFRIVLPLAHNESA